MHPLEQFGAALLLAVLIYEFFDVMSYLISRGE